MSAMEFNKLAGAILVAALVFMTINVGIDEALRRAPDATVAYPVPMEEGAETAAAEAEEPAGAPLGVLLAAADAGSGEKIAKKCSACHSFDKGGKNKVGPNLWNVVGAEIGKVGGFSYSDAMAGMGGSWDYATLDDFLRKPKELVPGTKMSFAGIKKPEDRADLLVFLRDLADSPMPLPAAE